MSLGVFQQLQTIGMYIGVTLIVVDGDIVASAVKGRIGDACLTKLVGVNHGVEFIVFVTGLSN